MTLTERLTETESFIQQEAGMGEWREGRGVWSRKQSGEGERVRDVKKEKGEERFVAIMFTLTCILADSGWQTGYKISGREQDGKMR